MQASSHNDWLVNISLWLSISYHEKREEDDDKHWRFAGTTNIRSINSFLDIFWWQRDRRSTWRCVGPAIRRRRNGDLDTPPAAEHAILELRQEKEDQQCRYNENAPMCRFWHMHDYVVRKIRMSKKTFIYLDGLGENFLTYRRADSRVFKFAHFHPIHSVRQTSASPIVLIVYFSLDNKLFLRILLPFYPNEIERPLQSVGSLQYRRHVSTYLLVVGWKKGRGGRQEYLHWVSILA